MTKSLSVDLRTRIVALIRSGVSRREAAARFAVTPPTAVRFAKLDEETGAVCTRPMGRPRGSGKFSTHIDFLIEVVESSLGITGPEMGGGAFECKGRRGPSQFNHPSLHTAVNRIRWLR